MVYICQPIFFLKKLGRSFLCSVGEFGDFYFRARILAHIQRNDNNLKRREYVAGYHSVSQYFPLPHASRMPRSQVRITIDSLLSK
jgi:hypothetical protein